MHISVIHKLKEILGLDKDCELSDVICILDEKINKETLYVLSEKQLQRTINLIFLKQLRQDLEKLL